MNDPAQGNSKHSSITKAHPYLVPKLISFFKRVYNVFLNIHSTLYEHSLKSNSPNNLTQYPQMWSILPLGHIVPVIPYSRIQHTIALQQELSSWKWDWIKTRYTKKMKNKIFILDSKQTANPLYDYTLESLIERYRVFILSLTGANFSISHG